MNNVIFNKIYLTLLKFYGLRNYLCNLKSTIKSSDTNRILPSSLVFLAVLPEFLSAPVCSTSDVHHEQVLGKVLLPFHLGLSRQFLFVS